MNKPNKPAFDTIVVVIEAAQQRGLTFPITQVSNFEIRGDGVLLLTSGGKNFRAFASGQWETVFLADSKAAAAQGQMSESQPPVVPTPEQVAEVVSMIEKNQTEQKN